MHPGILQWASHCFQLGQVISGLEEPLRNRSVIPGFPLRPANPFSPDPVAALRKGLWVPVGALPAVAGGFRNPDHGPKPGDHICVLLVHKDSREVTSDIADGYCNVREAALAGDPVASLEQHLLRDGLKVLILAGHEMLPLLLREGWPLTT